MPPIAVKSKAVISDAITAVQSDELRKIEHYAILADDADEEIVEIFIEEAVEVLGELHTHLPQWRANSDNEEALAVIRRSFHTLKGSGRLLGAELIGEFSWKFENILNRVIENKINVTDSLLNVLDEALAVLPQLIEQLKGNREPIENIGQLMLSADAIADGREVSLASVEEVSVEEVSAEEDSSTVDVSDAAEPEVTELEITEADAGDVETEADSDLETIDLETDDEIELIVSGDVSSEILIGDSSDVDIAELDPDNNLAEVVEDVTAELTTAVSDADEEIVISDDVSIEFDELADDLSVELDADTDADDLAVDDSVTDDSAIDDLETGADELDEIITLDAGAETEEDDFEIEISEVAEDISDAQTVEDISTDDELVDLSIETEADDDYEIVIDEGGAGSDTDAILDIDPMLLKIYLDESQAHVEVIRQLVAKSEADNTSLKASKELIRAFHTLYGSARTAEVEPIADIAGAAEKYIKARQECDEKEIPEDVTAVIIEVEQSISDMLSAVVKTQMPARNKPLHEKINKIVQQEIQRQLQQSWQDNSVPVDDVPVSDSDELSAEELSADDLPAEALPVDDIDEGDEITINIDDLSPDMGDESIEEIVSTTAPVAEQAMVMSYGDIDDELIDIFLEEADELLESCEDTLTEIKNTPNSTEHIQQLQRNMHTLKGGARMADLAPVGDLTHNLESLVVMVSEGKIEADNAVFDLLQESLDVITGLLEGVRKREALIPANDLNTRIEMFMRGEVAEKRSIERFDVDLSELESDDEEELEDVDISSLLPAAKEDLATEEEQEEEQSTLEASEDIAEDISEAEEIIRIVDDTDTEEASEAEAKDTATDARPHWGERASDVNFKESTEQVRVRSDLLNNLVNYAGEVNIYHARMGKQITDFGFNLAELTQTVDRLKNQLRNLEIETEIQIRSGYEKESDAYDDNFDPLEMDQYSTLQQLTRSLSETAGDVESINDILTDITRESETLLVQESRISTDLQEGLMRTRMVRFGGLSSRLRRVVRQVARELGKEIEVDIKGDSSEVDRTVLDRIIAPLEHMLRNAVAHGIETPAARIAQGKKETGTITIDVDRQGTDVLIIVKDDGAGISVDKIRDKAIKLGFMEADAELSDHDALQFILQSGFSTAEEVTQVAGRGVGLDVVDSEIKQLGGVLEIDTTQGKGTEFKVRLPLTLAINQALLVSTVDDVFAIPLASIEGVVRITGLELQRFYDSDSSYYEFNGIEYELRHLGGMLTGNQGDYSRQLQLFPVLLVHVGDKHFALHVEDLIGRREIVVKPVGMQIGAVVYCGCNYPCRWSCRAHPGDVCTGRC